MSLVTLYVFRITPQTQGAPNSPSTYPAPFFVLTPKNLERWKKKN